MFGIFKKLFAQNDNTELAKALNNGAFLADVRTPSEFSAGSVKGAVNIPLDKLPVQISKFNNKKVIIVFCRSGARSSQAKMLLEKNGFKNVVNGGSWLNVQKAITKS